MKNLLYIFLFVPIALFGQENYSLSFDGVDDYVDITSSSNYPSNIGTISVSFKLDNAHISQTYDLPLFMIDNGLSDPIVIRVGQCLCDAPGASLSFSNDDCGGSSPEVKAYWGNDTTYLYDGNWHNITLVVGDDYHEIYLDGSKLELIYTIGNELVGSFLYGAETELFYFGKRDLDNYSSFFQGYMDNIQLWDRPLNANEIRQYIFETPPLGNEFGFQSAWNFNQGEGEYVSDISINENLAILQGPVYLMTESNFILGCTDELFIEFNSEAGINDGSCQITWQEQSYIDMFDSLQVELNEINNSSIIALSSLQQALDTWNTTIDLSAGWNMFGYGCPTSIDLAEGLYNHTESVVIVKDNNGSVYMPEFSFNGIGDLTPGFGYQIKVSVAIEGFSLCDWYVNDIPEDNIVSLQDSLELIISQIGCIDSLACNYDITHIYYDGSCEYISCVNCMDESACNYNSEAIIDYGLCEYPQYGFDCNEFVIAEIGDEFQGGILFYINETGQHGIVAAPEDIGSYAWGCPETPISGADGQAVGAGYLNTLEIVSGCSQTPIAASRSLAYVNEGYLDWYLPSFDELTLMYSNISQGSPNGNSGGFINDYYWSSSESVDNIRAWLVYFGSGNSFDYLKQNEISVRPIRSF